MKNRLLPTSSRAGRISWSLVFLVSSFFPNGTCHGKAEDFFTQSGTDPVFAEVLESGKLTRGKNSLNGFTGSKISVNHGLLEDSPNAHRPLLREILIHTLGHSAIRRNDFPNWTRWYQEDGNTQVFRLFKDEENVRNSRKLAARIEAHSEHSWKKGDGWQEWVATYTIIKPHRCAIFQAKNPVNDWSVMINMNDDGDVNINHRRGEDKLLARNMTGKPFHIRIRENGHDYEVYFNGKKEGQGTYERPERNTNFRWGMYLGAKPVRHDAMILVTGAAINPKDSEVAMIVKPEAEQPAAEEPVEYEGMLIPSRKWENKRGDTVAAEARHKPGTAFIELKIEGKWIPYPLDDLSDAHRGEIAKAIEVFGR